MATNRQKIKFRDLGPERFDQRTASAVIKCGMLLAIAATGKVAPHATEGGDGELIIALEDRLDGGGIAADYAINDIVNIDFPQAGDERLVLVAAEEVIAAGDTLVSNGDGYWKKAAGTEEAPFVRMRAAEALNLTGLDPALIVARA
jgi:hypothetical protein